MKRTFEQMIASADDAVEQMRGAFEIEHERNIVALRDAWNLVKSQKITPCDLSTVFRISHDIKGQGGTFGRDILTSIAGQLCSLLTRLDKSELPLKALNAVECHVAALELVTRQKITGDGGDVGAQLIAGLTKIGRMIE